MNNHSRSGRIFTPEQIRFLQDNYAGKSAAAMTEMFNLAFQTAITLQQIRTAVHNRGINSGRTGRFEKGLTPWNRDKKGYIGANPTSFVKGNRPANWQPLGTERIDSKDGFILVKIAERNPYTGAPTRYKHKHVHVWETLHGPVPKGHVVAFRDGIKINCEPDNLMLLTRAELLVLNQHGYKDVPPELQPAVLALVKVEAKAGFRTRPGRGRRAAKRPSCLQPVRSGSDREKVCG
jgi:hypothetical protein